MPLKVTENAWVKVPQKPLRRRRKVDPLEQREALCSPLRYFSCTPMGSKDRIRMLSRPVSGMSGMVDVDRAPSPVDFDEGAGLMFSNGSRGGDNGGRRSRRLDRIVSEPVHVIGREPSIYETEEQEEEIVEVIEEASTLGDDTKSQRSHRSHCCHRARPSKPESQTRSSRSAAGYKHDDPIPRPIPAPSTRSISPPPPSVAGYKSHHHRRHQDDYSELQSNRSASPPPHSISSHKIRHRERQYDRDREPLPPSTLPSSQSRTNHQYRTVSTPSAAPRPTTTTTSYNNNSRTSRPQDHYPSSSGSYRFESAIFQPKSSSNHYRDVHRNRGTSASEGGRWASATSALSFD